MNLLLSKCYAVFLIFFITGCDFSEKKTTLEPVAESSDYLNEYPTRDRVKYVLDCVAKHGGLNYINQYACGCKVDKIAEQLNFKDFEAANTFGYLRKTPGENGSAFRDPKQSKSLGKRLKAAEAMAEKSCFIK
ncbi:MAG: hypothetical protein KAU26_08210 [Methylococcales bacterium]|nr:hypothetical protein [Methylococcales bacterium]